MIGAAYSWLEQKFRLRHEVNTKNSASLFIVGLPSDLDVSATDVRAVFLRPEILLAAHLIDRLHCFSRLVVSLCQHISHLIAQLSTLSTSLNQEAGIAKVHVHCVFLSA